MIKKVVEELGRNPECITADGGYWSSGSLVYVEEQCLNAYIAPSGFKEDPHKDREYDEVTDTWSVTDGTVYEFKGRKTKNGIKYKSYRSETNHELLVRDDAKRVNGMREKVGNRSGSGAIPNGSE